MTMDTAPAWQAPLAGGPIVGEVRLPGSKSMTNRALVLAALATEPTELRGALVARDTQLMVNGLISLGTEIETEGTTVRIAPAPFGDGASVDCGLAGTVMRFLPPVAALAHGPVSFDGDPRARQRPMAPLLEGLQQLGVEVRSGTGRLPFTVVATGAVRGDAVTMDASSSSQFVSALLLAAARFDNGLFLRHCGPPLPSLPHVDMTVRMLRAAGGVVVTDTSNPSDASWHVESGLLTPPSGPIEPDLSNAGPFLAAAMVTGGRVTVPDWPQDTSQAGDRLRVIFSEMGADAQLAASGLTLYGPERPRGITIDMSDVGELVPTVAAVCAVASGPSQITGVGHLRGHETDRLKAVVTELGRLGITAVELPDGLAISPDSARVRAGEVRSYHDHRMATFGAILGLVIPGVTVSDIATTSKTLPDFPHLWSELVGA